ncbi:MAG: restriction endonuclease [Candidatus Aenigmatarchaeota archaeon]
MTLVTKADGRKEEFKKEKIIRTCLRMGTSQEQAKIVADEIEKRVYDEIETKKILKMIFKFLQKFKPEVKHQRDLREAISLIKPKPDFERFVQFILKEYGYEIIPNQIIQGYCVEHEIDAIAKKENQTILVEIKHHSNPHTYTGKDVFLEVQAILEDLIEGKKVNKHSLDFHKILIVCNTKFSEHAKRYAFCKKIDFLGWGYPEERSLERLIEGKKLYPITILKNLDEGSKEKFVNSRIILLKQLLEESLEELHKRTKISIKKLKIFVKNAREIIRANNLTLN